MQIWGAACCDCALNNIIYWRSLFLFVELLSACVTGSAVSERGNSHDDCKFYKYITIYILPQPTLWHCYKTINQNGRWTWTWPNRLCASNLLLCACHYTCTVKIYPEKIEKKQWKDLFAQIRKKTCHMKGDRYFISHVYGNHCTLLCPVSHYPSYVSTALC